MPKLESDKLKIWACGWVDTNGVEHAEVFDTKYKAQECLDSLAKGCFTQADIWDMMEPHSSSH